MYVCHVVMLLRAALSDGYRAIVLRREWYKVLACNIVVIVAPYRIQCNSSCNSSPYKTQCNSSSNKSPCRILYLKLLPNPTLSLTLTLLSSAT